MKTTPRQVTKFTIRNEDGEEIDIKVPSLNEAREAAHKYAKASLFESEWTVWFDTIIADENGDIEKVTTRIDPPTPDCRAAEHSWTAPIDLVGGIRENPGVVGHGGGVICKEICERCGTLRVTNTWAHRPDTGEQGLESVRFEPYRYEREMTTAEVTLSSASLGDSATEDDFDAWVSFVGEHIDEATGLVVSVDAKRFGDAGDDDVMATLESNVTLIKEQLRELWDRWCSESLVASV